MALQIACVDVTREPTRAALTAIHKDRVGNALFDLVVAASSSDRTWLYGPHTEAAILSLPKDQAMRVLAGALGEPTGHLATQRMAQLRRSLETSENLGITNAGLFANHHLRANVPHRSDWSGAGDRARPWLSKRRRDLIIAMGYTESRAGQDAMLLKPSGPNAARAVALLLNDDEQFEAQSHRFNLTPIAYGLKVAAQMQVPWLIVMRDGQIRLYPAKDGVGVGQRSQADTFFELDLTVLPEDQAALLALVFSAEALQPDGSTDDILKGSSRYAIELGARLRDRVYEHVVPQLSTAVAERLPSIGIALNSENLTTAYRLTLKILFRLLFQAYAEDRGLLPYDRNQTYTANALKTLVTRDLLTQSADSWESDAPALWADLKQVWRVIDVGHPGWSVPAYNGGLFGTDPERHPEGALLERLELPDSVMGPVLRHLLVDRTDQDTEGPVDFRSLSVREFGTIYEGLLESSLSLAEEDLTLDKSGAWIPAKEGDRVEAPAGTAYFHNSSGERKATGSYFTPSILVEHLLDRALEPALAKHLEEVKALLDAGKEAQAADKFFDFRVADLAMGSAHFLVAAIDRIETGFRNFLVDNQVPRVRHELQRLAEAAKDALGADAQYAGDIDEAMLLRRQIARRCIYGLDINEMAVELARLAIWIHTFVPGLPMSTLDHGLVCANSLTGIGTMDEALQAIDPDAADGGLYLNEIEAALFKAKELLVDAANASEATKQEVVAAAELLSQAKAAAEPIKYVFDAAVALRLGDLTQNFDTVANFEKLGRSQLVQDVVAPLVPAHMPYLFPEVFLRENSGFDVLLGNPPWEKLHVKEDVWWALRFPGFMTLPSPQRAAFTKKMLAAQPNLGIELQDEEDHHEKIKRAIVAADYPGIGAAHLDLFAAFAWRNWRFLSTGGRSGLVLPRTAIVGSSMMAWRKEILAIGSFEQVIVLGNSHRWIFPSVHPQYSVALLSVSRSEGQLVRFSGPWYSASDFLGWRKENVEVVKTEFSSWSKTFAFPLISDSRGAEIFQRMRQAPAFGVVNDAWDFKPVQGDVNISTAKKLLDFSSTDDSGYPVWMGSAFNLWDPNYGEAYARSTPALLDELTAKAKRTSRSATSAYAGLTINSVEDTAVSRCRIAMRLITNQTNSRTGIFCLVPPRTVLGHGAPFLMRRKGDEKTEALLLGILSSYCFDWYARRWVELNFTFELLNAMPIPKFPRSSPIPSRLTVVAGRLAAVDERFAEWARAVGVLCGSVSTEEEKSELIAENDALAFLLYGLDEGQVLHVFKTFHKGVYDESHYEKVMRYYDQWKTQA